MNRDQRNSPMFQDGSEVVEDYVAPASVVKATSQKKRTTVWYAWYVGWYLFCGLMAFTAANHSSLGIDPWMWVCAALFVECVVNMMGW